MKSTILSAVLAIAATLGSPAKAQIYDTNNVVVQTFAGSGFSGYVDGVGVLTMFDNPTWLVVDSQGNLFVWDSANTRMREIAPDSTVSTFVGGGSNPGFGFGVVGVGTSVAFQGTLRPPSAMAIDTNDEIWGGFQYGVFTITKDATVTVTSKQGSWNPNGMCADSARTIYMTSGNQVYRNFSAWVGSGNRGYADGNGVFTAFNGPTALAADAANNIYVWDSGNHLIRRIDQNHNVTTFAGTYTTNSVTDADGVGLGAAFDSVNGMCFDGAGNLILACGTSIRMISASTNVTTLAGSFTQAGYTNGLGNLARFNGASGICVSQGRIFVVDTSNQRIRSISFNPSAQPVLPANLQLGTYPGLRITGTVGRAYQIQSSPDMTVWTTLATVLLPISPYLWIDQNPVSGNSFYRVLLLP